MPPTTTLDRADQVLRESRDLVKDIRVSIGQEPDLPMAIAAVGEQLSSVYAIPFRGRIEGAKRYLQPMVCEEGSLIVREALANAFTHAGASHIESEVIFGTRELRIRIRDDGDLRNRIVDKTTIAYRFGDIKRLGIFQSFDNALRPFEFHVNWQSLKHCRGALARGPINVRRSKPHP